MISSANTSGASSGTKSPADGRCRSRTAEKPPWSRSDQLVGKHDVVPAEPGNHETVVSPVPGPAVQEHDRRPFPGTVVGEPETVCRVTDGHARSLAGDHGLSRRRPPARLCRAGLGRAVGRAWLGGMRVWPGG